MATPGSSKQIAPAPSTSSRALTVRPVPQDLDGPRLFNEAQNVTEAINWVRSVQNDSNRYYLQDYFLSQLIGRHDAYADWIITFYDYAVDDKAWQSVLPQEEARQRWDEAEQIKKNRQSSRQQTDTSVARLKGAYPDAPIDSILGPHPSRSFARAVQKAFDTGKKQGISWDYILRRANQVMIYRIQRRARGLSRTLGYMSYDFDHVFEQEFAANIPDSNTLKQMGLFYGEKGILTTSSSNRRSLSADVPPALEIGQTYDLARQAVVGSQTDDEHGRAQDLNRPRPSSEAPTALSRAIAATTNSNEEEVLHEQAWVHESIERELTPAEMNAIRDTTERDLNPERRKAKQKAAQWIVEQQTSRATSSILSDVPSLISSPSLFDKQAERVECNCSSEAADYKKAVINGKASGPGRGEAHHAKLLAMFAHLDSIDELPCHAHLRELATQMHMISSLPTAELVRRFRVCAVHRNNLGHLRAHRDTYSWWRMTARPVRASDRLGVYRFSHHDIAEPVIADDSLRRFLVLTSSSYDGEWQQTGNITANLFDWWQHRTIDIFGTRVTIMEAVRLEFDMYRHHLRERNNRKNFGWQRNQVHSLGQQLMRMDPCYYALYVFLRPDHHWRLISYPYYAKYAVPGDSTFFRHIDVNVHELLESGRGKNMIQGTVSLDDEDDSNCTELVPGMHDEERLRFWHDTMEERAPSSLSAYVNRMDEKHLPNDILKTLGLAWKKAPCQAGAVRVTNPAIPHGSTGPATKIRRTMLPWFVGIQDDHEAMEVTEMGTWSMLSAAHRDLVAPDFTPSGKSNAYGKIPYAFPGAVQLATTSSLSAALVGRQKWTMHSVTYERNIMLMGSDEDRTAYINDWRDQMTANFAEAYQQMLFAENASFGEKAYWYNRERGTLDDIEEDVDPDPTPEGTTSQGMGLHGGE